MLASVCLIELSRLSLDDSRLERFEEYVSRMLFFALAASCFAWSIGLLCASESAAAYSAFAPSSCGFSASIPSLTSFSLSFKLVNVLSSVPILISLFLKLTSA